MVGKQVSPPSCHHRGFLWILLCAVLFWGLSQASVHASARVSGDSVRTPVTSTTSSAQRQAREATKIENHELTSLDIAPVWKNTLAYAAPYFYLALLFVGITLPAYFFRRRMVLMKGRMGIVLEERNRIARECHDTLMAGITAISWQLEATANLLRDDHMESTPAVASCELARSMVAQCRSEARRIIWDLREANESSSVLSRALTRSIAANPKSGAITTTLEVEGEEIPLAPVCVHHLVCIGQEAVTNAIRHAAPSRVSIYLKYESDRVRLCVRDNGCGIRARPSAVDTSGHFGISVMKERAEKLGGTFRIQPLTGHGTEVVVQVPFYESSHTISRGQQTIRWIGI